MWPKTETIRAENVTASQNFHPMAMPACSAPGSNAADSAVSTTAEASPTQAWNCSGFTPSICFISTAPSEPVPTDASTSSRPAEMLTPCGSHITAKAPVSVRPMPSSRRRLSRSPRIRKDRNVVVGTISWLTMAADDGLTVRSAMNMKANEPAPMHTAISSRRQSGRGGFLSQGNTASATMPNRTAA